MDPLCTVRAHSCCCTFMVVEIAESWFAPSESCVAGSYRTKQTFRCKTEPAGGVLRLNSFNAMRPSGQYRRNGRNISLLPVSPSALHILLLTNPITCSQSAEGRYAPIALIGWSGNNDHFKTGTLIVFTGIRTSPGGSPFSPWLPLIKSCHSFGK
jgi:hypothetical protein